MKLKTAKKFSFISFFVLLLISCNQNYVGDVSPIDSEFETILERYKESSNGGWKNNLNGRFSWDDSYVLDGLVYVFRVEGKNRYLDSFIELADVIIKSKDSDFNYIDSYRGNRSLSGWGSTRYTKDNTHHIFNILDALILSSLTSFYNVVNTSKVPKFYQEKANEYLKVVLKSFEEVQAPDFINISTNSGYFQDPYFTFLGMHTPVNQFARVGTLCIELFKATKNIKYFNFASKTAQYLKDNLIYHENILLWNYGYYPLNSKKFDKIDDVSHGTLVVEFMSKCFDMGIVFSKDDMIRLVNLFLTKIYKDGGFNLNIDGSGGILSSNDVYIHYFLLLSKHNRKVYDIISGWYLSQNYVCDKGTFLNHFGEKLVLMNGLLRFYK